jgi:membrane peptidoglycan carboxypeptidase
VLNRMAEQGYITPSQEAEARLAPLGLSPAPAPRRGCVQASVGPYVCDFVQKYVTQTLGISQQELDTGGLVIQTTLDPELQRSGDAAVLNTLPLEDERVATFNAVEPGTGHLLALSVNRIFGYDVNDSTQESYNLNVAPSRGAGSTYKVFVAAAALARGYSTQYTLNAPSPYRSRVYKEDGGPYTVENAGRYRGTLDLTTALYQSSNTYFVALEDALGSVEEPVRMAQRMGLYQFGPPDLSEQVIEENRGSFTLGPDATSPLGLASAYSTLAAGGTQCNVLPVTGILDRFGQPLTGDDGAPLVKADNCTPEAIPAGVANTLNQMLRKDVEPGNPGQTAPAAYVRGHEIAGKTGTAQGNVSVAFVGYTPEITASVMVFNPKVNQNVGGFGGGKGATVWRDAMAPILEARGSGVFPPADPTVVIGNTIPVPGCSSVADCVRVLAAAGFQSTTVTVRSAERQGALVGTSPARGGRAVPGQVVSILVSNGADYVEPRPTPAPAPPPVPAEPAPAPPTPPSPSPPVGTEPLQPAIPSLPGPPWGGGPPGQERSPGG